MVCSQQTFMWPGPCMEDLYIMICVVVGVPWGLSYWTVPHKYNGPSVVLTHKSCPLQLYCCQDLEFTRET